jgi:DNA-directed RNA polymerase subunit D
MKSEVVESNDSVFRFVLKDTSDAYANALRRMALSHVKCFAIDRVTFYDNTSAIFDEYIAHRIGLVPIVTPSSGYSETDEILFTLDATGPKTVYSRELESSDKEVKVKNGNIPLIKLAQDQHLRIEAKAILGDGLKHAKFQPGIVTYEKADNNFNFYVETFGQMPPKQIVSKALEVLKSELKELEKETKKL